MAVRQRLTEMIAERTTPTITAIIKDAAGVAVPAASLATLVLTIYDLMGGLHDIINLVEDINILNTGRGTVDAAGFLTLTLTALDTAILDDTRRYEHRVLLLEFTYGPSGAKIGRVELVATIVNMVRVE